MSFRFGEGLDGLPLVLGIGLGWYSSLRFVCCLTVSGGGIAS